ncbi:MAG TPA: glycoside hydrolase family 9 [Bacteroidetes bacterium]|nr:glycoside hydrolase family 9 [Bacteroidota bacterium]
MMRRWLFTIIIYCFVLIPTVKSSVMVNQAGYFPNGQKIFFTTTLADSFRVVEKSTNAVAFSGKLTLSKANDPSTGLTVYKGDFSSLKQPGTYYVSVSLSEQSYEFSISDTVFHSVFHKSLKGFYFQRCGQSLNALFAGIYARAGCHGNDGTYHSTSDSTGFRSASGGWHDAGDYGKYIVNAGVTVGTLLMAYELFPTRFSYDNLGILESKNSVPDILDEVRFELNWMLKMQHSGGGVYFKLTREQFEGFVMPSADNATRYLYQISTTATGDFAAVFARAARVYKPFDQKFSDSCLAVSRRAWAYLQSHPSIVPTGGFKNPSGTATGEYGDGNDSDERLWAAAELFSTTGEPEFNSYYSTRYATGALLSQPMGWPNVRTMAHLAYLYTKQATASTLNKIALRQSLLDYGTSLVNATKSDGFSVAISKDEYYWGSNSGVLNKAILLILASRENSDASMLNAALAQLNYILGNNAHNISFVTGIGAHHVLHPHHRPSSADGIVAPVPGLLSGGPEQGRSDPVLQAKFSAVTPPAMIYTDEEGSYASNEIAINWNAPLVFVAGYFAAEGTSTGIGLREESQLNEFQLHQNYPNPFNPSTKINYQLPVNNHVSLRVYDSIGREVKTLVNEEQEAGQYSATFNASTLASGLYFYNMQAGSFVESRKMMLIK